MRASSKEEIETTKIYVSENKMGIRASVRVSARQRAKEEKIVKAEREMKIARQQAGKIGYATFQKHNAPKLLTKKCTSKTHLSTVSKKNCESSVF